MSKLQTNKLSLFKGPEPNTVDNYAAQGQKLLAIIRALIFFLATIMNPLSLFDKESFRAFTRIIDPRIKFPGRTSLTQNHFPRVYHEATEKFRSKLDKVTIIFIAKP